MAFRFNPFTGKLDFDTTNDGLASNYASQAASSATAAEASATNAATSEANAATSATNAANSYDAIVDSQDIAHSLFFKATATAYNINTNTDFGGITTSGFTDEVTNTLLSMVLGSSSFDYGSV